MIFNSLTYLLLLLMVIPCYRLVPNRVRMWLILATSLTFYSFWRLEFLPIMLVSVGVDFIVASKMPSSSLETKKKLLLTSLVANLGLLFYFKYLIFFSENAVGLAHLFGINLDPIALKIILPLGISFYTFQTISYTVDCYRGVIKPEKDFVLYASYVTFFPQLVAGPILRAREVIYQLESKAPFSWSDLGWGVRRICYGLFLKVVIADNLSPFVDTGFMIPIEAMGALDVWTLAFMFGFQIYFDFSAYSHIALGSAKIMGISFPENFNFPYTASSPKEFWRRWHISLSSWIRDYLYLPLSGVKYENRSVGGLEVSVSKGNTNKALFYSWAIMGLWHGANWTFVLWGIYHAMFIFLYRKFSPFFEPMPKVVTRYGGLIITLPLIMLAWVPFRASSVEKTLKMWGKVIDPSAYFSLGMREDAYVIAFIISVGFFIIYWIKQYLLPKIRSRMNYLSISIEIMGFAIMVSLIIIFLRPINQFIYFQF